MGHRRHLHLDARPGNPARQPKPADERLPHPAPQADRLRAIPAHARLEPPPASHRLQATFFAGHDYRLNGVDSFGRREVASYTTLDLISRYQISKKDTVTVG